MNKLIKLSFLNALTTGIYVTLISVVMQNAERVFGKMNNLFGPVTFLLLFVLSAAITGSLILGRPMLMYINGDKSDAVKLFLYTLGWLALGIIILLLLSRI